MITKEIAFIIRSLSNTQRYVLTYVSIAVLGLWWWYMPYAHMQSQIDALQNRMITYTAQSADLLVLENHKKIFSKVPAHPTDAVQKILSAVPATGNRVVSYSLAQSSPKYALEAHQIQLAIEGTFATTMSLLSKFPFDFPLAIDRIDMQRKGAQKIVCKVAFTVYHQKK